MNRSRNSKTISTFSRCEKCHGKAERFISFFAQLFFHPALRSYLNWTPEVKVHICNDCLGAGQLPVVDITNSQILEWQPSLKVLAPDTKLTLGSSAPSTA